MRHRQNAWIVAVSTLGTMALVYFVHGEAISMPDLIGCVLLSAGISYAADFTMKVLKP